MTDQAEKKRTERRASDDYPTPAHVVAAFLPMIEWMRVRSFLEPCAGDGAILNAVAERMPHPFQVKHWCEIRRGSNYLTQFMTPRHVGSDGVPAVSFYDLCITNPPFNLATEFLAKALDEAATVCFLLRASWPAGSARAAFIQARPPTHVYYLTQRPAFVATCQRKGCTQSAPLGTRECECGGPMRDTTDFHEYAWFCWDRGRFLKSRAPFNWI